MVHNMSLSIQVQPIGPYNLGCFRLLKICSACGGQDALQPSDTIEAYVVVNICCP